MHKFNIKHLVICAGKYEACGNVYSFQHSQLIAVDPLSDQVHTPYQLKDMPYFWWESEEKDMFSLVIYDPGYLNIKGFYINIRGSNVTTGEVGALIWSYAQRTCHNLGEGNQAVNWYPVG